MAARLRGVGIALTLCLLSAPVAVVATVVLLPFWSWLERAFGFEAVGHSGPGEWCYLLVYLALLAGAAMIWSLVGRRRNGQEKKGKGPSPEATAGPGRGPGNRPDSDIP